MNVQMPESGAAKIMGEACKNTALNEVTVYFSNDYDKALVYITIFSANPQEQGYGTKAMQFICQIADIHGYNIVLKPQLGNKERLSKFYQSFGFKYINEREMFRQHTDQLKTKGMRK